MTDEKPKRHANRQQRLALKAADVAIFVRQYGRKAQKGVEPNDRKYNRNVQRRIGRMDPLELDRLMRKDEDTTQRDSEMPGRHGGASPDGHASK